MSKEELVPCPDCGELIPKGREHPKRGKAYSWNMPLPRDFRIPGDGDTLEDG